DRVLLAAREVVVQPGVHRGVFVGQVEGVRVPVEDPLHRDLCEDAVDVADGGLGLLGTADGVEALPAAGWTEPDAGERLLDRARTGAAPARREVRRLALLPRALPPVARPLAEGRVVHARRAEVAIEDQVVALRILPQLLPREAEHGPGRILELLGDL